MKRDHSPFSLQLQGPRFEPFVSAELGVRRRVRIKDKFYLVMTESYLNAVRPS